MRSSLSESSSPGDVPAASFRWQMAGDAAGIEACSASPSPHSCPPPRTRTLPPAVEEDCKTCPFRESISRTSSHEALYGLSRLILQPAPGHPPATLMGCAQDALSSSDEPPSDTAGDLDASEVRRSNSSPLPLSRGEAHEGEEPADPAAANERPPMLDLTAAPSASSLHSSLPSSPVTPEIRSSRRSTSFRGMSSESSSKAALEQESLSLEPRGDIRNVAASERASAEKTSPALAAVISVHSTKEFFFCRAPEGHLTYKLPMTSYGETSFFKLLAPDDVAESGIAASNEVGCGRRRAAYPQIRAMRTNPVLLYTAPLALTAVCRLLTILLYTMRWMRAAWRGYSASPLIDSAESTLRHVCYMKSSSHYEQ